MSTLILSYTLSYHTSKSTTTSATIRRNDALLASPLGVIIATQMPTFGGLFYRKCRDNGEMSLINDVFGLKNGRLFRNGEASQRFQLRGSGPKFLGT